MELMNKAKKLTFLRGTIQKKQREKVMIHALWTTCRELKTVNSAPNRGYKFSAAQKFGGIIPKKKKKRAANEITGREIHFSKSANGYNFAVMFA